MIYEIRNYHFDPTLFDAYKTWAKEEALPFLERQVDLVGFWVNTDCASEVIRAPLDDLGSANVTWIVRWPDRKTRDDAWERILGGEEWAAIFAKVPGGMESYRRLELKLTEALH